MRRLRPFAALAVGAASCFVGTLNLAGLACDQTHTCTPGYECVSGDGGGVCEPAGSAVDAGICTASCASDGLHLCDGGIEACGPGGSCAYHACLPACSDGGCGAGTICDQGTNACVALDGCALDGGPCALPASLPGGAGICLAGVCTPAPTTATVPLGTCSAPEDGGLVTVQGHITRFPDTYADDANLVGGTVVFYPPGEYQTPDASVAITQVAASNGGEVPFFTATVPAGTWTVLVQAAQGYLPTYFPNLSIEPSPGGETQLDLETVVADGPTALGIATAPGHLTWVGRAVTCPGAAAPQFVSGYTVGLSPSPPLLAYYQNGEAAAGPASSEGDGAAEFIAVDAPYATTRYSFAVQPLPGGPAQLLLSGSFTPPPFAPGDSIAVALVYPPRGP